MKIEYSDWGLANRIGNTIILNKNLKNNPWLHQILLEHEEGHGDTLGFDIKYDFKSLTQTTLKELTMRIAFMIKHPKSLIQISPIWIYKGRPYLDASLIIMYLLAAGIIYLFY